MSELAEGARLLSEYTGLNLYRGFNSLSLRHSKRKAGFSEPAFLCLLAWKFANLWDSSVGFCKKLPSGESYDLGFLGLRIRYFVHVDHLVQ